MSLFKQAEAWGSVRLLDEGKPWPEALDHFCDP